MILNVGDEILFIRYKDIKIGIVKNQDNFLIPHEYGILVENEMWTVWAEEIFCKATKIAKLLYV